MTQSRAVRVGRRVSAGAVAMALIGTAACGGGAKPKAATTTTALPTTSTTVAPTTTTVDATKAAILAAYRAHWDDVIAVSNSFPVNPLDPRLAAHTIGKQLTSEQQALTRISFLGRYEAGPLSLSPKVTSISAESAVVMDCDFDHSVEIDGQTKATIHPPDIGHSLLQFALTKVNSAWYVSDSKTLKSGKTVDSCDPAAI